MLGETQTLCAGAVFAGRSQKGGAKNVRSTAGPLPGGAERPKFNQLKMVTIYLGEDRCTHFELSWQQTHPHTTRQDRLQYTARQPARSIINKSA